MSKSRNSLRKKLIRLAHSKPDLRKDILPLLVGGRRTAASYWLGEIERKTIDPSIRNKGLHQSAREIKLSSKVRKALIDYLYKNEIGMWKQNMRSWQKHYVNNSQEYLQMSGPDFVRRPLPQKYGSGRVIVYGKHAIDLNKQSDAWIAQKVIREGWRTLSRSGAGSFVQEIIEALGAENFTSNPRREKYLKNLFKGVVFKPENLDLNQAQEDDFGAWFRKKEVPVAPPVVKREIPVEPSCPSWWYLVSCEE